MLESDQRPPPPDTIAAFDFDGTLTTRDSFFAFIRSCRPPARLAADCLATMPLLALYAAGLAPNSAHKMALFRRCFAGMPLAEYRDQAASFSREELPRMLRATAIGCLRRHKERGHRVVIVTASFADWIEPWAASEGVDEVIASCAEVEDGRITGRMAGPNCHGPEKLRRLLARFPEPTTYRLFAYGDSPGDRALLAAANHAFYRRFK